MIAHLSYYETHNTENTRKRGIRITLKDKQ